MTHTFASHKVYSRAAALVFVLWAAFLFHITPQLAAVFAMAREQLPFCIRATLFIGGWGWLAFGCICALLAIRFNGIRSSLALAIVVLVVTAFIVVPVMSFRFDRSHSISVKTGNSLAQP